MSIARRSTQAVKLLRLLTSPGGRRGLRHGVAKTVEHHRALAGLKFYSVVDIGANKGQFSLFARDMWPDALIYAFEPLPGPAERFRQVFAGDPSVRLYEVAVGPKEDDATMYVSQREDSSSLLPIADRQVQVFPGTELKETRTIRVAPLDKFVHPVNFSGPVLLKIDVQGFELEVLKGCESALHAFQHIYVECSFTELYTGQVLAGEVIDYLARRNFRLVGIFNQSADSEGRPVQADFLFSNR